MKTVTLQEGQCCDCKWMKRWMENQAPMGSGYMWNETFEECICNDALTDDTLTEEEQDLLGRDEAHPCKYWEGKTISICKAHGEYVEQCEECNDILYRAMRGEEEEAREWDIEQHDKRD